MEAVLDFLIRWVLVTTALLGVTAVLWLLRLHKLVRVLRPGVTAIAYPLRVRFAARLGVQQTVIGHLATVVRQGLPLAPGVAAAADSERGSAGRILSRIAYWLGQGLPLSTALRRGYDICPGLIVSTVATAEQLGQLPQALTFMEQHLAQRSRQRSAESNRWPYFAAVLTVTVLIISGLCVVVVPRFKEIFEDFGTEMPPLTRWLIDALPRHHGELATFIPLAALLTPLVVAYVRVRPRRPDKPRWLSRIGDWLAWSLPGVRRITEATGMAWAVRMLRLGLGAGATMDESARCAAATDVNAHLRRRLRRWAHCMTQGMAPNDAAARVGLHPVFVRALTDGMRGRQMDPAMRYAEDYFGASASHWAVILRQASWPIGVLLIAGCVGTLVVATFLPIPALIEGVLASMV